MVVRTIPVGGMGVNCYIVSCDRTNEAIIIDPGGDASLILGIVAAESLCVRLIVNTHGHFDHIAANAEVKSGLCSLSRSSSACRPDGGETVIIRSDQVTPVAVGVSCGIAIHVEDSDCLTDPERNLSAFLEGFGTVESPPADHLLMHGDVIQFGDSSLEVLHTPGHTAGSICLLGEGILFSGDTLFREGIGRTDLPGGDEATLLESLEEVIFPLDGAVRVLPGHGQSTTVEYERVHNPFR